MESVASVFLGAVAVLSLVAVALFGWSDVWFFATTVMARGLDGSVMDPYNPGLASMTAFLRRTFISEPELNPHPMWNNPIGLLLSENRVRSRRVGISLLALAKQRLSHETQALAWFVIVLFVLSPNEASYTFVLFAGADCASVRWHPEDLVGDPDCPVHSGGTPLYSRDAPFFPKAWLMLGLFIFAGWSFLRTLPPAALGGAMLAVVSVSTAATVQNMRGYRSETAQTMRPAVIESDAIYAASPAFGGDGWIYEGIADERYLLRKSTAAGIQTYKFDGDAFHPAASRRGRQIAFELAANGHSRIELFDPDTKELRAAVGDASESSRAGSVGGWYEAR